MSKLAAMYEDKGAPARRKAEVVMYASHWVVRVDGTRYFRGFDPDNRVRYFTVMYPEHGLPIMDREFADQVASYLCRLEEDDRRVGPGTDHQKEPRRCPKCFVPITHGTHCELPLCGGVLREEDQ
jgi:hypothetical protein